MTTIRSLLLKTEVCKSMDKVQTDCKAGFISLNGAKKMNPNEEIEVKDGDVLVRKNTKVILKGEKK